MRVKGVMPSHSARTPPINGRAGANPQHALIIIMVMTVTQQYTPQHMSQPPHQPRTTMAQAAIHAHTHTVPPTDEATVTVYTGASR